uniref:Putative mitochondrial ribosomal protein l28 n=1 Tax=Corethrella appendiculata TaxID=1370023 RepID=U5EX92_9DIPT
MGTPAQQGTKLVQRFKRPGLFDREWGALLPEAYKKFWNEWRIKQPTAVHYIPKEGKFERNELTGEVKVIQNIPIPLKFPKEADEGIWGGEGIIKGFQKRNPLKRRVPHFWTPVLHRSVVHSVVLNKHMAVTVTDRTIDLIIESHGFDHYLLKTPACDLKSVLALKLKQNILLELSNGCPSLANEPEKQEEILKEYSKYLDQYTAEEIEWYGLTYKQACDKIKRETEAKEREQKLPHKIIFRQKLIEQLEQAGIAEAKGDLNSESTKNLQDATSWLSKMNPFSKKKET